LGRTRKVYSIKIVPGANLLKLPTGFLTSASSRKDTHSMQIKIKLASAMRRLDQLKNKNDHGNDFDQGEGQELIIESDDYLAKKFVWTIAIGGAAVFFIGLPLLLSILQIVMPVVIMNVLWMMAKIGMTLVLLVFGYAVYMTLVKSDN